MPGLRVVVILLALYEWRVRENHTRLLQVKVVFVRTGGFAVWRLIVCG